MRININQEIHFLNETRKVINLIANTIPDQLKQFEGQKIAKVNGLTKKFLETMAKPEINPTPYNSDHASLQYFVFQVDEYSLYIKFSICFSGGSYEDNSYYCCYKDDYIYLGKMKNQILVGFYDIPKRAIIDEQTELTNIKEYCEKRKELDLLKEKISVGEAFYKYA